VPTRVRQIPDFRSSNSLSPLELYNQAGIESAPDAKILYVAITSDRGLCGGIHSSVSKTAKKALLAHPEARVVVCGDKPKAQLSRMMPQQMALSFNQIGKDIPTFAEAAAIADEITTHGGEWDELKIIYNKYISAISYEATTVTVAGPKALAEAAGFKAYEMEEDVSKDLTEFALANIIFQALVEGHAAEQSARRTAMENASNVGRELAGMWMCADGCSRTPTI
jgi:F-type H+-transporting ATPase subunit gamma